MSKTKEEIYCRNGGSYIRSKATEGHLKAMQEYSDQQLELFKEKLKEEITEKYKYYPFGHHSSGAAKQIINLIDTIKL